MAAPVNRSRDQGKNNNRRLSRTSALGFLMAAVLGAGFAVAGQRDVPRKVTPRASRQRTSKPSAQASSSGDAAPLIPTSVLEKIPPRASGADGQPGDFVNFLIVGTEADMKLAFQAAGWTTVGHMKADATSPDPPASLSQEEYLAMPLHEQFIFGKSQDYGFVCNALVTVVPARHDVRIWKVPFAVNGRALWVGAASHEGPWWDNSAGTVSYAAVPNVDEERDFLGNSLQTTGLVERSGYVGEPGKTPPEASEGLRTDGRVFVMMLIHL
jgi:hypothetical protein